MKKNIKFLMLLLPTVILFNACSKDDDTVEDNENEVITTLEVVLTEQGTSNVQTFTFDDPDGPGGDDATIDDIVLEANKTYSVVLVLLDKTKDPVEVVSEEVEEEAIDHRFYFEPSAGANITVSNLDTDDNGIPVGLTSTWTTGDAGTGTIAITLRHYEEGGKEAGDLVTDTKSSTDVAVTFNTTVE